jgi:hypothetical protein
MTVGALDLVNWLCCLDLALGVLMRGGEWRGGKGGGSGLEGFLTNEERRRET